jgi:L-malate glycosyltransferase
VIRIAFLIDTIETPTAGTENQLIHLIRSLDRSRFEPHLFVLRSSAWIRTHYHDSELHDLALGSLGSLSILNKLSSLAGVLSRGNFKIIQTHFIDANKIGCAVKPFSGGCKLIGTRRNIGHWQRAMDLRTLRVLNHFVDIFVANSVQAKAHACAAEGIDPSRVCVIHNGVNLGAFKCDRNVERTKVRSQLSLSPTAPVIGLVANLRPPKAIDVFLRAARLVRNVQPDARFLIIGDGPLRESLEALCKELEISDSVSFLGKSENVARLLASFDVGVLSSASESMPNSLLEYMAAGLPVVCTNSGGCTEIVKDGQNGFLVPCGDSKRLADRILHIIQQNLFRELGVRARRFVESSFSSESMVRKHEDLFISLVTRSGIPWENSDPLPC